MRTRFRVMIMGLAALPLLAQSAGQVEFLGTYRGVGGQYASAVGPGPAGSERLYATYLYLNKTFDILAIDPLTMKTQVFPNPVKGEYAARCMTVGPDGNLYLGTAPNAHFVRLEPRTGQVTDLGRPSSTESFIWDLAFGSDGKLYGGTNPNAKLVRYDPATRKVEDLGRMDPVEDYAHYVAASSDGFVYAGIGAAKMNVAAYKVDGGEHREILPAAYQIPGQANVYKGTDGKVYAVAGKQYLLLQGWEAKPIEAAKAAPPLYLDRMKDGHTFSLKGRALRLRHIATGEIQDRPFSYDGNELPIFRLGLGPDGQIYGSSALPAHLFRWDAKAGGFTDLADLGGGEVYSFLSANRQLLMAAYGTDAPLYALDPARPLREGPPTPNPVPVDFANSDKGWRPTALIQAANGKAYVGAVAGYGKLGGPLCLWDPVSRQVEQYPNLIQDQSVVALCVWGDKILGGTTINGGMGSHPTQKDAKVFAYDPATRKVVFEIPVPGVTGIDNLQMGPNGLLYGIGGHTWFALDPVTRKLLFRNELPFPGGVIYASLSVGDDGRIWGLAGHPAAGIFTIDPGTQSIRIEAKAPKGITAGLVRKDGYVYFACESELYRFALPRGRPR